MAKKKATQRYGPPLPSQKKSKQDRPAFGGDFTRSLTYYRAMGGTANAMTSGAATAGLGRVEQGVAALERGAQGPARPSLTSTRALSAEAPGVRFPKAPKPPKAVGFPMQMKFKPGNNMNNVASGGTKAALPPSHPDRTMKRGSGGSGQPPAGIMYAGGVTKKAAPKAKATNQSNTRRS